MDSIDQERPTQRGRRASPRERAGRVALAIAGLVLADLGGRALLALLGAPYDGDAVRALAAAGASATNGAPDRNEVPWSAPGIAGNTPTTLLPHPYFGYDFPSRADSITRFSVLLETPEWRELERTAEPYVILVVGGSVSQGFTDLEVGGMARFQELLERDPRFENRTIAVVGQGRSGFKQPQQLALVTWMLGLGLTPHAVINLDGFNEVAFGMSNASYEAHPLYPWFGFWSRIAESGTTGAALERTLSIRELDRDWRGCAELVLAVGAYRSCILGTIARVRMERFASRRHALGEALLEELGGERSIRGPRFADGPDDVLDMVVRNWVESSRSLHGLLAERSIFYLHALQPTLHDEGSKPVTDEERANGKMPESSMRGVALGYPRLRRAGEELRALGVPFVDCSGVFRDVRETIYVDSCHFVRAGNEILAETLASAFLDALPD
jgi:hypothetical protein